ncbi:Por secretion system C-terminal sorting domain-containing protein [Fodinibius salinus]|uniref:Por secretion system C-terminal sorting domain-containing protein n=1 Tax=Fodinibius salinus TaxID=860790 RepID=A0A5D3YNQ7_9BACT|nr:lamin tail domain-containing protein [Fodinibius salinus]TYP94988.1 Por secretion system C-terminal sorting domain-containing protein [Fodinibius salinus]
MGTRIRIKLLISAICCTLLALGLTVQPALSQLSAGDVVFTGFNSDSPGDGFAVVLLSSVSGGQQIHFTSEGWNGSDFTGAGGSITWQAPAGGITAGTVLTFSDVEDVPWVNLGTVTDDTDMDLSGSGDVIYAFLGSDKDTPETPSSSAFLGTISSDLALYSQPDGTEGTLANTGLTEDGNEVILLPDNVDNAEYIGDRNGNTPDGYRTLVNDVGTKEATDDNWDIYNGNDVAPFPSFNDESFAIFSPPTIAFTSSTASGDEGNSVNLTVELVQATNADVDVDVVFLGSSSSAVSSDINNFSSQTVRFKEASTGATKNISIPIAESDGFENTEKAVFQVQNNTAGSIITPKLLTLTINDKDAPDVVINELLTEPHTDASGDVNGDGSRSASDDEFIEIVNNESTEIDISGWQLSADGETNVIHTFPDGTVLGAGKAIVVFGGGTPASGFGNAIIQTSTETGLSFTNSSGNVRLLDASGNVLQDIVYGGTGEPNAGDGQSVTRDPDISGSFVKHSNAKGSSGAIFSPGTKIDGTAFGSATYAIGIRGSEGWRMVSTPTSGTSVSDLFGGLWMQGITGSDDPSGDGTVFSWDEAAGSFTAPAGISSTLTPGKGYIVYVFEDNELSTPGVQGGFPKIVNTDNAENASPVSIQVTANDNDNNSTIDNNEGWNLLGNPFGTDISVDALIAALKTVDPNVNTNILVWNSDTDSYETLSSGDTIAPFQAFFVRYTIDGVSGTVNLNRSNLAANTGATFYKKRNETESEFSISLHGSEYSDPFHVSFSEGGEVALDPHDAYKLFSLDPNAINLYGVEGANKLLKDELPENLDKKIEIPLGFVAPDRQELRFKWKGLRSLPAGWTVTLIDRELKQEVDLSRISEYKFTADIPLNNDSPTKEDPLYAKTSEGNSDVRFVLAINPGMAAGASDNKLPNTVKLNPNYPNPFNPRTTLSFELTQESDVTLTIWNMIGQKVTTLVDGVREAGEHTESWNASNLPSGIYIARFEVGTQVFTRKMTLIK